MDDALHIRRLEARYRLGHATLSARERLDRLLRETLDAAVELALECAGISADEELCIRSLYVPVRLRLGASDPDLVAQWGHSFADYVRESLDNNDGRSVVHYRSRLHGLIDFASGVALGRYRRAWAWAQMGFSRGLDKASDTHYAADLVQSGLNEPAFIVPMLKHMARSGYLARLIVRLNGEAWTAWAGAALSVAGADADTIEPVAAAAPGAHKGMVVRLLEASALAKAVIQAPSVIAHRSVVLRAFGVLAILETEPGLSCLDKDTLIALIGAVERGLTERLEAADAADAALQARQAERLRPPVNVQATLGGTRQDKAPVFERGASEQTFTYSNRETIEADPDRNKVSKRRLGLDESGAIDADAGRVADSAEAGSHNASLDTQAAAPKPSDDDYALPAGQACGSTDFGGLLLLVKLVEALNIPDESLRHLSLSQRSLRWVLHRLALVLVDVDVHDPAVLAFCGLEPETTLPWDREAQASAFEHALLLRWRSAIVDGLRSRLDRNDVSDARLLDEVCRRRARIVSDPGWFEIIYSLNDVSTEYRRVGLDLDPGYVPWLGAVMRFTYE